MDLESFNDFFERFVGAPSLIGSNVRAKVLIHQSPCTTAPDVPKGRAGSIDAVDDDDDDDVRIWVDFGGSYGTVLCDPDEIEKE